MESWRNHLNEEKKGKAYRITLSKDVDMETIEDIQLEILGIGEKIVDKSQEGYIEISATPKGVEGVVKYFKEKRLPLNLFTNDKGDPVAK